MSEELKMALIKRSSGGSDSTGGTPKGGKVKSAVKGGVAIAATVATIAGAAVVEGVQGAVTGRNPNTPPQQ